MIPVFSQTLPSMVFKTSVTVEGDCYDNVEGPAVSRKGRNNHGKLYILTIG